MELKRITLNELKEIIKEELGIYKSIFDKTIEVYNAIVQDLPNRGKKHNENGEFIVQKGSIRTELDGHSFSVYYTYRNFKNRDVVDVYGEANLTMGSSSYIGRYRAICNIDLYGVSGTIRKEKAVETIQHELEHIFQEFRADASIPNGDFYAKMRNDLESNDENRRKIGRLIYGCLKSEQEGYINGLYSYCMVDDFITPPYNYSNIVDSDAGKLYVEISDILKELRNDINLQNILKEYGWSIKKVETHIINFIHRIGRVLIKVNNDKIKLGWRE